MTDLWESIVLVCLHTTHYLSIAVWVGVMLFNLIVNFPAMRERSKSPSDYAASMAAQGRRAGPWLYILIFLTAASGWALSLLHEDASIAPFGALALAKTVLLLLMLSLHLWGSYRIWPRIHFAVKEEWPKLFTQYQLTIVLSSVFGIAAIVLTYLGRFSAAE